MRIWAARERASGGIRYGEYVRARGMPIHPDAFVEDAMRSSRLADYASRSQDVAPIIWVPANPVSEGTPGGAA
jgi:hypothetical protein